MSADSLVWVRRRNGRWWPGQVLGPEELPDSLPSTKGGTPIKLLAKEDPNVDWYDVENSPIVKAFRCGEYDKCIEKARVAAFSKRAVRHASREEAILRALEIEGTGLDKDHPPICSETKIKQDQHTVEDSPVPFDVRDEEEISVVHDPNNPDNDSYTEEEIVLDAYEQEPLMPNPNEYEDGGKGVQRMKGLNDLGMDVVSSLKRKRPTVPLVHEFLKRKHRRRTVTKILHSTEVVNIPVTCEDLAHPTLSLPLGSAIRIGPESEFDVIKRSFSLEENDASFDGLCDVPIVTEEEYIAGDCLPYSTSQNAHTGDGTKFSQSRQVRNEILRGAEDVNESRSSSSEAAENNDMWQKVEKGTPLWQSTKKRSRHSSRRRRQNSIKFMDMKEEYDPYIAGGGRVVDCSLTRGCPPSDSLSHSLKSKPVGNIQVDECGRWSMNAPQKNSCIDETPAELQIHPRLLPYRQSRFSVNPKYQGFSLGHQTVEPPSLFDVNVEVRANHRPHHVPYVSLMSKFSGRPVVGHPLALEIMVDEISDDNLGNSDSYSSSCEEDYDSGDNISALGDTDLDLGARSNSGGKVLMKKVKKLSSLTIAHKQREDKKLIINQTRGPSLACIPLKIVFTRLGEALTSSNRSLYRP